MPKCPQCSAEMVLRLARHGRNAGKHFYGCSRFPQCKGTRAYAGDSINTTSKASAANKSPLTNGAKNSATPPQPIQAPKELRPLTEQQRKELIKLRDRLLNLSSRNRSIRLNRLDAKWTFDFSALNPFGIEIANDLLQHCLKSNTAKS